VLHVCPSIYLFFPGTETFAHRHPQEQCHRRRGIAERVVRIAMAASQQSAVS
jgi:hypothetical protein